MIALCFRYGLCTSYLESITKNIRNEEVTNTGNDVTERKLEDEMQNMKIDCPIGTKVFL